MYGDHRYSNQLLEVSRIHQSKKMDEGLSDLDGRMGWMEEFGLRKEEGFMAEWGWMEEWRWMKEWGWSGWMVT